MSDLTRAVLVKYWGYPSFRPMQEDIVDSVIAGHDTLALLPTGGGKSICFQVPALAMEGVCIVVTPLISLMKDQVQHLKNINIPASAIYSGMHPSEVEIAYNKAVFGNLKFLYVSPERLMTDAFVEAIKKMKVCLLAIDESHCISQWGYDFRPAYLRIADIRDSFPEVPVLALTATATPEVVDDIQARLMFREKNVLKKSFRRDNLCYVVRQTDNKEEQMLHILDRVPGSSIVYVRNRKKTLETAEFLTKSGITATHFHAGLTNRQKDEKQKDWKSGATRVIVATNAFGMGIDKPDVRTVIHLDLPDSIEAYFQEAGRAGRDGKTAYAVLLYNKTDDTKLKKRIHDNYPEPDFLKKVYEAVGNYLEVGVGSGLDHTFVFPLEKFCIEKKLPMLQTYSALQLLQQGGFLNYIEETETSPRIMILSTREELYSAHMSPLQERIVGLLLRTYTGIFAEPVYINENILCEQLGITVRQLSEELITLAKEHLLQYIPRRKTPYINYPLERQELQYVVLPPSTYEQRLQLYTKRLNAMLEYASQTQFCRSQLLLSYFGETESEPCGQCDVCRRKAKE